MFTLSTYSLCTIVKGLSSPFLHFLNISEIGGNNWSDRWQALKHTDSPLFLAF
jgi:hypothetical protein